MTVVPAIIPNTLEHLTETLQSLHGCASEIQIDIVDGVFVPFRSWPYQGSGSVHLLRQITERYAVEVDLMIEAPLEALPLYVEAGVQKIVVHLESIKNKRLLYAHHESHSYALGLSVSNSTPLDLLIEELPHADYVQLMGIREIGSQGQPFDEEVLKRIAFIRSIEPEMTISIDGSVNSTTLPRLKAAGANRFVAGSAILGAHDPVAAYRALANL